MKKIILFIVLISVSFHFTIHAQFVTGLYLTASDYSNKKLSYTSSEVNKTKIKLHNDFYKPYIQVTTGNTTIKLNKDSVFGYRDNKENDFRFNTQDERIYKIIENKTKVKYIALLPVIIPKGNAIQLVSTYFYSNTLTSPILPLTTINNK